MSSPQTYVQVLTTIRVTVTIFGQKGFTDVIKLSRGNPNLMAGVLKRRVNLDTDTGAWEGMPHENRQRYMCKPRIIGNC